MRESIVYVIADRNRLIKRLVDTLLEAAKLRAQLSTVADQASQASASIQERIAFCEERAAYVEQQLLASAKATQALLHGLRELIRELPQDAASALARLEASKRLAGDKN